MAPKTIKLNGIKKIKSIMYYEMGTPCGSLMAVCCCVPETLGWAIQLWQVCLLLRDAAGSNVTSRSREGNTVPVSCVHGQFTHEDRSRSSSGTGRRGQEVVRAWKCSSAGFYFHLATQGAKPAESENGKELEVWAERKAGSRHPEEKTGESLD